MTTGHATHSFVCPWWFIRTFDNPLRRWLQNPERLLRPLVREGDHCLDLGCGIGYFTIPLARLVGPTGRVTAVDLQPQMLAGVRRRSERADVSSRVTLLEADAGAADFGGPFDLALAFWMLHEVPDKASLLRQLSRSLKPGGRLVFVEPRGHVRGRAFAATVAIAEQCGFRPVADFRAALSRGLVLASPPASAA